MILDQKEFEYINIKLFIFILTFFVIICTSVFLAMYKYFFTRWLLENKMAQLATGIILSIIVYVGIIFVFYKLLVIFMRKKGTAIFYNDYFEINKNKECIEIKYKDIRNINYSRMVEMTFCKLKINTRNKAIKITGIYKHSGKITISGLKDVYYGIDIYRYKVITE